MGSETAVCLIPSALTFAVEITKALAWPFIVGGGLIYFRRALKYLLTNLARAARKLDHVKIGNVEMARTLRPEVQAAETEVEEAKEKLADPGKLSATDRQELVDQLAAASAELERLRLTQRHLLGKAESLALDAFHLGGRPIATTARAIVDEALRIAIAEGKSKADLSELAIPQINRFLMAGMDAMGRFDEVTEQGLIMRDYITQSGRPMTRLRNMMRTEVQRLLRE